MIGIQKAQNFLVRGIFAVILEDFHIGARRIVFAQARRQFHAAVHGIIMAEKAAKEADYDVRRRVRRRRMHGRLLRQGGTKKKEESKYGARHSTSPHNDGAIVSKVVEP